MDYKQLLSSYQSKFKTTPRVFRSPGRINIIGEHTDYNAGFVLPAGVDKEICVVMASNGTEVFNIYSHDTGEEVSFNWRNYSGVKNGWAQYIIGVIYLLRKAGHPIGGVDCVFGGDIPMGAGMSSSAALECATLFALNSLFNLNMDKRSIALMAQKAENEYVGVNCGIMDQFASVFSEKNHALKLDCRDLSYSTYSLDLKGYQLILVDSMVKHSLASSEYNVRRAECEAGVAEMQKTDRNIRALRDATMEQLIAHKDAMEGKVFQRCKYIIEEIARVTAACEAMERNDLKELGELLYATHYGLQHEFEISCEEIDFLVDFTRDKSQVLGARMMGGGFGGCSINLVSEKYADTFMTEIGDAYLMEYGKVPAIYPVRTASGSSEITEQILVNG